MSSLNHMVGVCCTSKNKNFFVVLSQVNIDSLQNNNNNNYYYCHASQGPLLLLVPEKHDFTKLANNLEGKYLLLPPVENNIQLELKNILNLM